MSNDPSLLQQLPVTQILIKIGSGAITMYAILPSLFPNDKAIDRRQSDSKMWDTASYPMSKNLDCTLNIYNGRMQNMHSNLLLLVGQHLIDLTNYIDFPNPCVISSNKCNIYCARGHFLPFPSFFHQVGHTKRGGGAERERE